MAAKKNTSTNKKKIKKVTGTFKYISRPGETLEFPFKIDKSPVESVKLVDGERTKITMDLLNHLRKSGKENIYEYRPDANGNSIMTLVGKKDRWYFEVEDFEDDDIEISEKIDIEID